MNDNSDTSAPAPVVDAPVAPAVDTPVYSNPNDLDFRLTEEQETEYVNQILANGHYEPPKEEVAPVVTPIAPVVEPVVEPVKEEAKVAPVVEATEITAPQTDDLWVEVEQVTVDDLGEETTKTVKLTYDPANPKSFIPDDFVAKNTKQLADIMDAKADMAKLYEERNTKYQGELDTKANADKEQALLDSWDSEIQDLVDAKVFTGADDAKVNEVYLYMAKENSARVADGRKIINSFGTAYSLFSNDAAVKQAEADKKVEDENVKKAGSMIGGGSAVSGGQSEGTAYKAGSYNSIWDIKVE